MSKQIRVCSLAGDVGFGFPLASLDRALALKPDVIALQGTSSDPGPYYLGAGRSFYPLGGVRRDLEILLPRARAAKVPVVISVGGAGTKSTVEPVVKAIREIVVAMGGKLRVAVIYADIDKQWLTGKLEAGLRAPRLGTWPSLSPELTVSDVAAATNLVAQVGPEPIMRALEEGVDLVVAGRTADVALFAALPILRGFDPGLALHMAKTVECGAMAAIPGTSADGIFAVLDGESFTIEPLAPERRCTIRSIAAHSFYERSDYERDDLPGGTVDTSEVAFEQIDSRQVRIRGSRWIPAETYNVKIEGAAVSGQRVACLAGLRDPIMIRQIDAVLDQTRAEVETRYAAEAARFNLDFRVYGRDAVMGVREPERDRLSHELGLLIDVVAEEIELAEDICAYARSAVNHNEFEGCRTSAGNVAFAYSPSDLKLGPTYRFNIWHLLPLEDPTAPFATEISTFGS